MTREKASGPILIEKNLEGESDKDIEQAKTLRDAERLERKDSQLWLLTIFVIIVVTLFILVKDFNPLNFSPVELINNLTSFQFSALVLPLAIALLGFCAYALSQNRKIRSGRKELFIQRVKQEREFGKMEKVMALFQISTGVANHKDLTAILETIARESLGCLKAHRSTLFLAEEKSGILKTQFTFSSDPLNEQVGLFEEKEVARRAFRQRKPFLLREPADFSEFFKYEGRDRKITSIISIPLISQGRGSGVLSVVIIDEDRKFTENDLQFLATLNNQASIAMENFHLLEEIGKGVSFRRNYEQYLDNILNQLQTLSDVERRRIEDHIGKLLPAQSVEEKAFLPEQTEEIEKGTIPIVEPMTIDHQEGERVTRVLQVDMEGEPPPVAYDLGDEGVFIRTPNPLDLGEQFFLKLHLAEGEPPVEVTCKVIWSNKYGKESRQLRRGMGVKFLNLSPELQKRMEDYIRSHKNKQFSFADDQPLSLKG
ncbi:MAG TPA: GAF domain-containing protein [Thermodesulfobacteriota bacterium]|nr:GAF domain-containing protein [Thermodesulfobacteriota bacterium]